MIEKLVSDIRAELYDEVLASGARVISGFKSNRGSRGGRRIGLRPALPGIGAATFLVAAVFALGYSALSHHPTSSGPTVGQGLAPTPSASIAAAASSPTATAARGSSRPDGRLEAAIAYDPTRNEVVLFGGADGLGGDPYGDTW
ncbi:MAG: hypothetical protein ACYDGR_08445 [Candidatus Dormibacteria bacterium]